MKLETMSDPIQAELAQAGSASGLSPDLLELEKSRITSTKVLPPMEFLFSLFDEPCFPRRELVAFTGRAKSGKTFVMSMLMVCCVVKELLTFKHNPPSTSDVSPLTSDIAPFRVLWYDTEQSDNSTQDILVNRIMPLFHRVIDTDELFPEHMFDIFNVRNVERTTRERYFLQAIEHYRPDLVILDGIRDLVADINDGTVAQDMMEKLMKTAQQHNCCIVCVLHQNKSGDSRDPRGWLGTELLNKAYDVFATEKLMPQRIFKLEQLYTRKYDIEQCLYFTVDDEGLPCVTEAPPAPTYMSMQDGQGMSEERPSLNDDYVIHHPSGDWEMDVPRLFTDVFQGYDSLTGAALRYAVMNLGHIATRSLYNNCLEKAMKLQLMQKSYDAQKRVIYRLNIPAKTSDIKHQTSNEPQQQTLWKDGDPF